MTQTDNHLPDNRHEYAPGYYQLPLEVLQRLHIIDGALRNLGPLEQSVVPETTPTNTQNTQLTTPLVDTLPVQSAEQLDTKQLGEQASAIAPPSAQLRESIDV